MSAVLEAAASLLGEHDPDEVTIGMIAGAAGVSTGWLYQFFPDKSALFQELLSRSLDTLDETLVAEGFTLDTADWRAAVHHGIDVIVQFVRDDPCFRTLWYSSVVDTRLIDSNRDHDLRFARYLAGQVGGRLRLDAGQDSVHVMQMFMGIIDKGVDLSFAFGEPDGDPSAVAEMKTAAVQYLARYLD